MEILLMMLMMLVVFNCAMKISLWPFGARRAFALLLGVFAYWSIDYAVIQSKTQIDSWLQREDVLHGIAIMVTVESAIGLMFCLSYLNDDGKKPGGRFVRMLLHAYPSLLVVPVTFYCLTRLLFLQVGVEFVTIGLIYAIAVMVMLTLFAELVRWLLPTNDLRVEAHLWLTVMVCLLSLLLTQKVEIIFLVHSEPIDWSSTLLTLSVAFIIVAIGFIGNRIKWKSRNNSRKWK